jgi:hypothetical protein
LHVNDQENLDIILAGNGYYSNNKIFLELFLSLTTSNIIPGIYNHVKIRKRKYVKKWKSFMSLRKDLKCHGFSELSELKLHMAEFRNPEMAKEIAGFGLEIMLRVKLK